MISSLCLSMISAQTRFAFVARENRFPLFRIMLWKGFRVCNAMRWRTAAKLPSFNAAAML
jgi:hypothetical protein